MRREGKYRVVFDSLAEMVEVGDRKTDHEEDRSSQRQDQERSEWARTKTWEEAKSLALHGYHDIRPQVDAIVGEILTDIREVEMDAFDWVYDVAGGEVDVARLLDGEPENMIEQVPVKIAKPGRVVSILIDGSYSASVDSENVKKRGAAIVALVDILARLQHSVEIWTELSVTGTGQGTYTILCPIKRTEEIMDVDSIMFAIAHPSFQRRIVLGVEEQEPIKTRQKFGFGIGVGRTRYGRPAQMVMGEKVGATVTVGKMRTWQKGADIVGQPVKWLREVLTGLELIEPEREE